MLQGQQLLTADARISGGATQTLAWFSETINMATAPSPASSSSAASSDAATSVLPTDSPVAGSSGVDSTATALASFVLKNGTMVQQQVSRVPGELVFPGALAYDAAGNVVSVLSTVRDNVASDATVSNNVFGIYEPAHLTLVRLYD
jgi:hypothetical protein